MCCQGYPAIQACPPPRAHEPLAEGIRLGTPRQGLPDPPPQVAYALVARQGAEGIAVVDQETVTMV